MDQVASLSPSRANDFTSCPLRYRFRVIDRLPEPPDAAAVRGTLVHAVLERLFDEPAAERTHERSVALLPATWQALQASEPVTGTLFGPDDVERETLWLDDCVALLATYFGLEDPALLEPRGRELALEHPLDDGPVLRGVVDRIDVSPDGLVRIVDYKTGRAPGPLHEAAALFQMRFYALVVWRTRGVMPTVLQLMYLRDGQVLRYSPDEADLLATERRVRAVWDAIARAAESGDFQPRPGFACRWCSHQDLCPAFGGTPPPMPRGVVPGTPEVA